MFLKISQNFHKKTPVLKSVFNEVAELKACNFIKKRLKQIPVNIVELLRTAFL